MKEIVPVKRVKNFTAKKIDDFKDAGTVSFEIEWRVPEEDEWYLYDALMHYVGSKLFYYLVHAY